MNLEKDGRKADVKKIGKNPHNWNISVLTKHGYEEKPLKKKSNSGINNKKR